MKIIATITAGAILAASLSGCASTGGIPTPNLSPAAQATLQAALDAYCPILGAIESTPGVPATSNVTAAEKVLDLACPPNPPPTNGVVAAVDIIQAYVVIEPLLPKKVALKARHDYAKAKVKYGLK